MAREYFCAYHSMLDQTKRLSDAELGRLFRALLSFSAEGVLPQGLSEKEAVAFDMLSSNIKRDIEAYEKQCKKNASNGSKGGRPRTKKSEKCKQNKASDDDESEKTERFSKKPKKANGFLKSQEEEKEEEKEEEEEEYNNHSITLFARESARMNYRGGELGGNIVMLSDDQFASLCEILTVDEIDKYMAIVRDCELKGKHFKSKTHYQAILDMVKKDRSVIGMKE